MASPTRRIAHRAGNGRTRAVVCREIRKDATVSGVEKLIWWNGDLVPESRALVPVTHLGWSGVEGVFEGMRGYFNPDQEEMYIFRLDAHMDRMMRSMRLMGLACPWSRDALMDACIATLRANNPREDVYLQPLAYVEEAASGGFFETSRFGAFVDWWPLASRLDADFSQRARFSSYRRISEDAMPPRVKNLSNYRNSSMVLREARRDGYDNAIVLNSAGSVAEGPNACIFLVRDGEVITPHLQSGILESITRDAVLTMVRAGLELPMYERAVDRTEIYLADELFFVGNAAEITPVTQVDGQTIGDGAIGPVTRRLRAGLKAIARGTTPEHAAWRTAVGLPVPALA
ncbi:MAG: branched-chain-amino-acid transaminase [Chloroflexia bacterium]|nr:branched-chain-amino-acid transaminase [Chloroflexia bacterium]